MSHTHRIYLDNAATSWPKPDSVYGAVERAMRELGAPAGRSTYREAAEVERLVADARLQLAELLEAEAPHHVIFTCNGTDALNLALHGILRPGDHVITSAVEHNSVLRPLRYLQQHREVEVTRVGCGSDGLVSPDDVRAAVRPDTKMIALIHVSNVTGAVQPVEEVGRLAAEHQLLYLIDAAQSLGHLEVHPRRLGAQLIAAPGHKGLLGPLGTGLLYVSPGVERQLEPLRQGGTGTQSESDMQPETLPDRYEAGNHNVPGIAGLGAGVAFVLGRGCQSARKHEQTLLTRLVNGLADIPRVTVYGPRDPQRRAAVVSITVAGYEPQEVALMLDAACSIQVRAGLHCAPAMHQALGTRAAGGTVRFSVGPFNTEDDIDAAVAGVAEIAAAATVP